jgi:ribonuclease Z
MHSHESFGIILEHESGWKLVYSGDTLPYEPLAELGIGATILIHEATLSDELSADANEKNHSSVS